MLWLISQIWNWLLGILFRHTVLVLTLMFCLGLGTALAHMESLSADLINSQAIDHAQLFAQSIINARTLYSDKAANRARQVPGFVVDYNYAEIPGAIPNPATFVIELGEHISEKMPGTVVRLYSDYPFPHRQNSGGAKDDFEREALESLREDPSKPFYNFEDYQGLRSLRYAQADIMNNSCVECHNSHPRSPKTDWQVGDVRGILEIIQPLNTVTKEVHMGLRSTFVTLGGLSLLGASGLTLVMGRLRRTATELERRVRERTADLAGANEALEQRNQLISQVFGRYLSSEVVTELLEKPEHLQLGGQRKNITILTSDLRGFTALSEILAPEEVVQILNLYLKYMSEIITQYHGTIDKFMGDGILVLFGAPHQSQDDTERAVACALAMQLAMDNVNEKITALGYPPLAMGIGINTGEVVVGNIGSEQRADYSVVGNQVNLTYRIESYTVGGQILISQSTFERVKSLVEVMRKQEVQPKGVKQPVQIYEVMGIAGQYNLFLPQEEEIFVTLSQPIYLQYTILEGKHLGENTFKAQLITLSLKGATIKTNQRRKDDLPPQLSNIQLKFWDATCPDCQEDTYGKVMWVKSQNNSFGICFTFQPPEVKIWLEKLYMSNK